MNGFQEGSDGDESDTGVDVEISKEKGGDTMCQCCKHAASRGVWGHAPTGKFFICTHHMIQYEYFFMDIQQYQN